MLDEIIAMNRFQKIPHASPSFTVFGDNTDRFFSAYFFDKTGFNPSPRR